MPTTLVCGDDPYLEKREVDKLLEGGETARFPSFSREALDALSGETLFGPPRVLVSADGLGDLDGKPFWEYLSAPNPGALLVIWVKNVDRRLKAWTRLKEERGIEIKWIKKASARVAAGFVLSVASRRGCEAERRLADRAVMLSGYETDPEVNFYALGNAMTALCDGMEEGRRTVTERDVDAFFGREDAINRFSAGGRLAAGDATLLLDAERLRRDCGGAVPLLLLLAREFRVAYKLKFFGEREVGARKTPLASWSARDILKGLLIVMEAARAVREGEIPDEAAVGPCVWKILQIRKAGNENG